MSTVGLAGTSSCSSLGGPQGGPAPFHIFLHLTYTAHSSSFSRTPRQKVFEPFNGGLISALDDSQSRSLKLWGTRRKQARAWTSGVYREPWSPFQLEPAPWSLLLSLPKMLRNQSSASHAARTGSSRNKETLKENIAAWDWTSTFP